MSISEHQILGVQKTKAQRQAVHQSRPDVRLRLSEGHFIPQKMLDNGFFNKQNVPKLAQKKYGISWSIGLGLLLLLILFLQGMKGILVILRAKKSYPIKEKSVTSFQVILSSLSNRLKTLLVPTKMSDPLDGESFCRPTRADSFNLYRFFFPTATTPNGKSPLKTSDFLHPSNPPRTPTLQGTEVNRFKLEVEVGMATKQPK